MPIPTPTPGAIWTKHPIQTGRSWQVTTVLTGPGQCSEPLECDFALDTVHIFGTFNGNSVSLLGFNAIDPEANPQSLHQTHVPLMDLTTASELLAAIIENPCYVVAVSNGPVVSVKIVLTMKG